METKIDLKKVTKEGECPICNAEFVYTDSFEFSDNAGYFRYTCQDCGFEGREWYNLIFCGHQAEDGQDII